MAPSTKQPKRKRRAQLYVVAAAGALVLLGGVSVYLLSGGGQRGAQAKPIILYVNQGNGVVNGSNFGEMTTFALTHGFNTVFFQVYRQGSLLFPPTQLATFVSESHSGGLKIFFALYITNSSQALPASIYGLGEDGISLDMSALSLSSQQTRLTDLKGSYRGTVAVTTINMTSQLKPDMLILETYGSGLQQYVRSGIVASVGVFATSSEQDYRSQFQYALQNSDGVMVFDYAGLLKRGY